MNRMEWIGKKNHMCALIKKISDHYGADDLEWLRAYTQEIIQKYTENIQEALDCFLDLDAQLRFILDNRFHVERFINKEVKPYESRFGRAVRMAKKREEI